MSSDHLVRTSPQGDVDGTGSPERAPVLIQAYDGRLPFLPKAPTVRRLHSVLDVGRGVDFKGDHKWLLDDPEVSRDHARIQNRNGRWVVTDLGSRNGTMVDDNPAGQDGIELRVGSVICVGNTFLVFRMVTASELAAIDRSFSEPFGPGPTPHSPRRPQASLIS